MSIGDEIMRVPKGAEVIIDRSKTGGDWPVGARHLTHVKGICMSGIPPHKNRGLFFIPEYEKLRVGHEGPLFGREENLLFLEQKGYKNSEFFYGFWHVDQTAVTPETIPELSEYE